MFRRRQRCGGLWLSVLLALFLVVSGIILVRGVVRRYYGPLAQTAESPETAPLDTP